MKIKLTFLSLALGVVAFNCTNSELETTPVSESSGVKASASRVAAVYGSRTVPFTHGDGRYLESQAISGFGNVDTPFNEFGNGRNSSNTLEVKIPKNTQSDTDPAPNGDGLRFNVDIEDGDEYELSYRVRFASDFKWSRGGKVGPGLVVGKGLSGCKPAISDGGSARFMWYGTGSNISETNVVYFQPYLYYTDQTTDCGTTFSKKSVNLQKNKWYTLYMRVKSNTGTNSDGAIVMKVDGVTLYSNTAFRWTKTTSSDRLVKKLSFNVFRGGSSDTWAATNDGFIYFDDIKWTKL